MASSRQGIETAGTADGPAAPARPADSGPNDAAAPATSPAPGAPAAAPGVPPETTPPIPPMRPGGIKQTLRALRSRNYRLFFGGQGISLVGTWMQQVALSWLIYRLTDSERMLGNLAFIGQLPVSLLAPLAGTLADRWSLRRALVGTQTAAMLQAAVLATLTLTGLITVPQILILAAVLGAINAFDMPIRQAFVVHMVEQPSDLSNAIALNSFLVNGARLIGPSLAGLLIAAIGEGPCFLLNAVSYIAVIGALLAMQLRPVSRVAHTTPLTHGLREGFRYALGFAPIRDVLGLLALASLTGMSYATLMPVFAKDILHGDSRTFGFLMGATGVGAALGAAYLASRHSATGLGRLIVAGCSIFGASLMAVSLSPVLWLSLPLMLFVGAGMMLLIVSCNTLLQTITDDDKRGRVMSFYTFAFIGMTPFGGLIAGHLADAIGAPWALFIAGSCCVVGAVLFAQRLPALRPLVRPIYIRKGILPEPPLSPPAPSAPQS